MIPVLRQPDSVSCGAASVEMARLLAAGEVVDQETFATRVRARHDRLTSLHPSGRWQVPWPRALGTPPWAVAADLGELTGVDHDVHLVRWRRSSYAFPATGGALYVGDRWLPRHVVLVLADGAGVYNPASGRVAPPALPLGRWTHPWFTVTGDPRSA